jgi:hypothetical protein
VVDTVIAKLLAEESKTTDLCTLIRGPNHIKLSELEPVLKRTRQFNALCALYEERREDGKLLEAWSK